MFCIATIPEFSRALANPKTRPLYGTKGCGRIAYNSYPQVTSRIQNCLIPQKLASHLICARGGKYGQGKARGKFDYLPSSDQVEDIPFHKGDIIELVDTSDSEGWWEGEFCGKVGVIPSNYLEFGSELSGPCELEVYSKQFLDQGNHHFDADDLKIEEGNIKIDHDDYFYVFNLARLYPPEAMEHDLTFKLRRELLCQFDATFNSDSFSPFALLNHPARVTFLFP